MNDNLSQEISLKSIPPPQFSHPSHIKSCTVQITVQLIKQIPKINGLSRTPAPTISHDRNLSVVANNVRPSTPTTSQLRHDLHATSFLALPFVYSDR